MKRIVKMLAITGVLLCMSIASALATPSTLVWIPSTDIQAPGVTHFGWDIYAEKETRPMHDIGLTFGGLRGKLEYGIDYLDFATDPNETGVWFNAKYAILEEKPTAPKVVLGAYNVGSSSDFAPNFLYVLGSKTFEFARVHLGVATGRESVLGDDNTMLLAGIDKAFTPKWWGAIDYQGGKSSFGALNAGVAYCFTPNTSLLVGYDWMNESSLVDTYTVQLDVNF